MEDINKEYQRKGGKRKKRKQMKIRENGRLKGK
jgi:hypothetical protein